VLKYVAVVRCSVLQWCTAVCCGVLQGFFAEESYSLRELTNCSCVVVQRCDAVCCSGVMQYVAVCCSVLQDSFAEET